MARHKITTQPAPEAELANITYWYQETGLPPVGDTDAGIVQHDLSGCTPLRPPRLYSRARRREGNRHVAASPAARNDSHTIVRVVVATRRSHHLDVGGPPGGLIDRFYARLLADHQSPSAETGGFLMDNRDCSSLGGHETVAAQRNNTLADIWRCYRQRICCCSRQRHS